MKVSFHPEARDEFVAAAEYYDHAVPGLGDRFLVAVRRAIELAVAHQHRKPGYWRERLSG